ncbi:MAG TPA: SufD family Fe-S cluster assembly protein [Nitrososphaeraceae archaeon]|jgi:Fe-S cluster assembly scaffold protein SufB
MSSSSVVSLSQLGTPYLEQITRQNSEPKWLSEIRTAAFSQYGILPLEVSPLYSKYSDANRLEPDHVFLPQADVKYEPNSDIKERIQELEKENETSILRIGPHIVRSHITESLLKKGVVLMDLKEALKKHGDVIKKRLVKNTLNYAEDKFLALEGSSFLSGIFIYVPRNVILEESIRLVNTLPDDGSSSISRDIIILETSSKSTIVQELYAPRLQNRDKSKGQQRQQAYFELLECHVEPNAHLEMVTLQAMDEENSVNFSNRKAFIERDAKMSWYMGLFGSKLSRYKIDSIMKGAGASADDVEIIFGIKDQSFDVTSNLIHYGESSRGRVLSKSVMKDTSKSLFKGMIKIGPNAKATESYLAGHSILLDKGAKSDAIPGLEIETNEVRATHSASVAQLDESQIFYLMSRGLSREGAKREIVGGFLEPLSRRMGPTIRAWVIYLIENKWSGKPLMLRTDQAMEHILEVEKSRYREVEDIFEKHYKYR